MAGTGFPDTRAGLGKHGGCHAILIANRRSIPQAKINFSKMGSQISSWCLILRMIPSCRNDGIWLPYQSMQTTLKTGEIICSLSQATDKSLSCAAAMTTTSRSSLLFERAIVKQDEAEDFVDTAEDSHTNRYPW
jgi:hypothetical protein